MMGTEVGNLCRPFGKHKVLKNMNFSIQDHEIIEFIGPNGAGKSTTMGCITSLIYPTSGQIIVEGRDLAKERGLALRYVSTMIEVPGLSPTLSDYKNLQYFTRLRHVDQRQIEEIAAFTCPHKSLDKHAGQYPMGMKQRLGLGIVMLGHPKFPILDEPANGLDPGGIMELYQELRQLTDDRDVLILMSLHQLGEVEKVTDQIIYINQEGTVETPSTIHGAHIYTFYMQEKDLAGIAAIHTEDVQLERVDQGIKAHPYDREGTDVYLQELPRLHTNIMDIIKEDVDIEFVYREIYGDGS